MKYMALLALAMVLIAGCSAPTFGRLEEEPSTLPGSDHVEFCGVNKFYEGYECPYAKASGSTIEVKLQSAYFPNLVEADADNAYLRVAHFPETRTQLYLNDIAGWDNKEELIDCDYTSISLEGDVLAMRISCAGSAAPSGGYYAVYSTIPIVIDATPEEVVTSSGAIFSDLRRCDIYEQVRTKCDLRVHVLAQAS